MVQVAATEEQLTFRAVDVKGQVFDAWRLKPTGQPETLPVP